MRCCTIDGGVFEHKDIKVNYMEYGHDEDCHTHDGIEMVYIIAGQGEHIINDKVIRTRRGSLIMMDYNCVHSFKMWETMKYYNILFKASFLGKDIERDAGLKELLKSYYEYDLNDRFLHVELNEEAAQKVEDLFFEVLEEGIKKKDRYTELIRCHIDEILNLMLRNMNMQNNNDDDLVFTEAINYISENCDKSLQLEDVAKKFNYKPRYFSNKLKEYCGLSFKQLLIRNRLSNVMYYLCQTQESIDVIIQKCGFTNKTYFYDVFEKTYGIKPKFIREYRKNYKKYLELKTKYKKLLN